MELEKAIENLKIIKEFAGDNYTFGQQGIRNLKENLQVVLNHLTKQEKMIDRMAKALHLFIWKNDEKIMITSKPKVSCQTLSIEEIKQYFEKKAEENL